MKLKLINKNHTETKNGLPYIELFFKDEATNKQVRYCIWSFVHNKASGLERVWQKALVAQVGSEYNVHFQKAEIQGQLQFVVTTLNVINPLAATLKR